MARRPDRLSRFVFAAILCSVLLFAFAIGCKSDNSGNPYGGGGGGGNPGANEVWIQGMAFDPGSKTVAVGTTITWTNKDAITHTVTSNNGVFDSGNLAPNATFSHQFSTAGVFPYHCAIHANMTGSITVQ